MKIRLHVDMDKKKKRNLIFTALVTFYNTAYTNLSHPHPHPRHALFNDNPRCSSSPLEFEWQMA
jgi:hypothetical protein